MNVRPENPVIVQGDGKVLVETSHRRHAEARDFLSRFAELEQSPEHLHTYRISPLSLWNAAAAGVSQTELVKGLKDLSKFGAGQQRAAHAAAGLVREHRQGGLGPSRGQRDDGGRRSALVGHPGRAPWAV